MITVRADHGGGPQHVFQLAGILARRIEVCIACPREQPYWDRYEKIVGPARMIEIPHRALRPGALAKLVRFVRRERIELVHSHGFGAGLYGRSIALAAGVPACHTPHGVTPAGGLGGWLKAAADFALSVMTTRIIAVSAGEAIQLRPRCLGRSRVVVIPNGVPIPAERVDPAVIEQRPLRVVHVTRFVFQKNPELFVAIIEELKKAGALDDFRFVLLGDGPDRAPIEARIAQLGLSPHVEFCGAVADVIAHFRRAFCLLSTSRWEGLPLALLEAMSVGLPVVATDVVGNRDAVEPGKTGFLFDVTRPAEGARQLIEIARARDVWNAQSSAARARAEADFSDTRMADRTLEMYGEALRLKSRL